MRFSSVFDYVDELLLAASAIQSYRTHKDESRLAEDLTTVMISAADEATDGQASSKIDQLEVRRIMGELVQVFEDALNL